MSKQFLQDIGVDLIIDKFPCEICLVKASCTANQRQCQDYRDFINHASDTWNLFCGEEKEYLKSLSDYVMVNINLFRQNHVRYGEYNEFEWDH